MARRNGAKRRRTGLVALACLATGGGLAAFWLFSAPIPPGVWAEPPATRILLDRGGEEIAVEPNALARDCRPLPLAAMGEWLPAATVAIEDRRFFSHPGVDLRRIAGALFHRLTGSRSGASTISQQLVKLAADSPPRTFAAKLAEARSALALERVMHKQEILERYLNRIDYGNRRIGPEAAARAYFGKGVAGLVLAEAIYLAGLPRSPTQLNPWQFPERALARYRSNVRRLARQGFLPEGVSVEVLLESPPSIRRHVPAAVAPHFAREAFQRAPRSGGHVVQGTLDAALQSRIQRLAGSHANRGRLPANAALAIVVVHVDSGEVRALVSAGNSGKFSTPFLRRSAGSTLKPFLYAHAIETGRFTAASILPDRPGAITEAFPDYDPRNHSGRYRGPVRLREALGNSLNVPAVHVLSRLGARQAFASVARWGFRFPGGFDRFGAGFILGNAPVNAVELAGAYAALARGGMARDPLLCRGEPGELVQAGDPAACTVVADILCDNAARAGAFGLASPLALPVRVAAKTGTSSGFRDAWCAGFTGRHAFAVWVGNLDGEPLGTSLAASTAAPIWAAVARMLLASGDPPVPKPLPSARLEYAEVCARTGLLPLPGERGIPEWFLAGTAPRQSASESLISGRWILPAEYAAWCASPHNAGGATALVGQLEILFPREGSTFALTPGIEKRRQSFRPQANRPDAVWLLDGKPLANPLVDLVPGTHTLEARHAGEHAVASFTVE